MVIGREVGDVQWINGQHLDVADRHHINHHRRVTLHPAEEVTALDRNPHVALGPQFGRS